VTGYGLADRASICGRGRDIFLHYHVQTSYGAHLVSYPVDTWGPFHGGNVVRW